MGAVKSGKKSTYTYVPDGTIPEGGEESTPEGPSLTYHVGRDPLVITTS